MRRYRILPGGGRSGQSYSWSRHHDRDDNGDMSTLERSPRVLAAIESLQARHERLTPARLAILEVLDTTDRHLDAEEILEQVAPQAPGVHRATVYRALSTLGDLGVVTHTHVGGSAMVYHLTVADPEHHHTAHTHAHLKCTVCGNVIDISTTTLRPLALALQRDLGFMLQPERAALLGTCANCR